MQIEAEKQNWHPVRIKFPGHVLHGKTLPARRCLQFSVHCWEIRREDGEIFVLPLNRAAGVGPAWSQNLSRSQQGALFDA